MAGITKTYLHQVAHTPVLCRFDGQCFWLVLSHCRDGRIRHVAASESQANSPFNHAVHDACAIISELLNRFASPFTLCELIHRHEDGAAASIMGAIILQITEYALEE
jgi:hypothetical protein